MGVSQNIFRKLLCWFNYWIALMSMRAHSCVNESIIAVQMIQDPPTGLLLSIVAGCTIDQLTTSFRTDKVVRR